MKIRRMVFTLPVALIFLLSLFCLSVAQSPDAGSCVGCHTDESALKSLVKPPKSGSQEGEG